MYRSRDDQSKCQKLQKWWANDDDDDDDYDYDDDDNDFILGT